MPYTATTYVNGQSPAISAANLNKLTDELESQAAAVSISHSLPTWANGVAPAVSSAAPLNEMERVLQVVATALGLSYTKTTWAEGWSPPRNATNLNKMEQQAAANRAEIDSQATGTISYIHDYTAARGQTTPTDFGWDWGMQYTGNVPTSNFSIISNGITTGLPSGRMTLQANGGTQSIEGLRKYTLGVGSKFFYGMMVKFPVGWVEPNSSGWGAAVAQFGYQGCTESTTGLFAHANYARFVLLSGEQVWPNGPGPNNAVVREFNNTDGEAQGPAPRVIPVGQMALGQWHQLIFEIRWSPCSTQSANYVTVGSAGLARCWHKLMGDSSWTQTMNYPDIPTLQWGPCRYGGSWPLNGNGSNVAHKFGLYAANAPGARTIEHGNIVIGDTFAIVAARMP